MKRFKNEKGFTLIELLIVIGILAVLAITILLALNPAEAQRKTRDLQRVKDLGTLQAVVDQFINDNPTVILGANITSTAVRNCSGGWLGAAIDVCGYIQQLPIDPNQGTQRLIATGGPTTITTTNGMNYQVRVLNGTYNICVRQESLSNNPKLIGDGAGTTGNHGAWVETGSALTLDCGVL